MVIMAIGLELEKFKRQVTKIDTYNRKPSTKETQNELVEGSIV